MATATHVSDHPPCRCPLDHSDFPNPDGDFGFVSGITDPNVCDQLCVDHSTAQGWALIASPTTLTISGAVCYIWRDLNLCSDTADTNDVAAGDVNDTATVPIILAAGNCKIACSSTHVPTLTPTQVPTLTPTVSSTGLPTTTTVPICDRRNLLNEIECGVAVCPEHGLSRHNDNDDDDNSDNEDNDDDDDADCYRAGRCVWISGQKCRCRHRRNCP